ncbi:ABC transporter [Chitiniphilus shinanonensis]|uniref:ABC transporter n=1 Tax=Chitiniphilus shinanonensis TaxID=553088 RepID=A0ABQ6BQ97_9NEIS|nr:ABC transporter [Chitiniphilus shinanonensis]
MGLEAKQYSKEFWALKNVSFTVQHGETVGIIGRNGSGKSTLLQMICGTLNPSAGSIQTQGRIAALLELGSGFNPEFTGRENVYMNGAVLGLTKYEVDAKFEEILAFSEIGEFIDRPVKTYSSGMMVRLAFSVAINATPEILIVDEALAVGDELFQRKCFSKIEALRAEGATILFVSHSGAQIIELCNRAILLDEGEQLITGSPKQVVGLYQKMLYAPKVKRAEIRAQFLQASQTSSVSSLQQQAYQLETSSSESEVVTETFEPDLKPMSSLDFDSHGPIIGTPEILTRDGRKVNGLIRGRRYRYQYDVTFHNSAENVRFGMAIKTTTGFTLAGALSAPTLSHAISFVNAGTVLNVEFTFEANFNPGIYFMNAGVFGIKDGEEIVLHRRADIVAFRILSIPNNIETETVACDFKFAIKNND